MYVALKPTRVERRTPLLEVSDFPASHGQAAIWFLYRIAPESAAYNIARAARLTEGIDPEALGRALQRLTDFHPALRTTFHDGPDGPVQRVHARLDAFLGVEDATHWTEEELQARLESESQRPFDLERGPLVRWHLFRRGPVEYVCHMNFHHIICDLWTLTLFIGQLSDLYAEEAGGAPAQLPVPGALYTDHVLEQRELLAGSEGGRLKAYWKEKLAGELPVLNLPTDRPRPAVQTYRGATRNRRIDGALSKAILGLGRKNGATPFATLLTVWQVLLHRYTGQEEIIIGSPTAGRAKREHGQVMGYFVNPVAIRADISGNPGFTDLLRRVKETVNGALQHAAYPFPLLADDLKVERDPSRNPIYQTMFVLQRAHKQAGLTAWALAEPDAPGYLGDKPGYSMPIQQQAAGCDLTMFVAEVDGELRASLEYNIDLFDHTTAERMLNHFVRLLEAIVAEPVRPVGLLPMLSEEELAQLLHTWNETAADYPKELCLHQLFERQAALTPHSVAVALEGESLTYAALNGRANQLAQRLRALGVGPDVLVGIFMERHPLLLVGMLAVLKAGGAYLPVDPTYPQERVTYILTDAQAPVILTQSHLAGLLGEQAATVICLDAEPAAGDDKNLESLAGPGHLAYVIYTSGSTGRPKGAMIHHQGLVNYLWWALHAYKVADGGGAPVHSSISFDLTVTSLWLPLLAGRRVELLSEARGIEALGGALTEPGGCSLVKLTPAHMELIARQLPAHRAASSTRALVIGGEALQPEALSFWRVHAPGTALINEYGPTETVVGCCVYWVEPDQPLGGSVPIGRPIANTQLYILDKYRQPVPVGVHGELYIGGDGVCRGYLNRPELTAERFVETTWGRLYKTGDLARYLPDGTLDFLGRIDEQVKIRGYRIELGEIESALAAHPAVDRVAVVVRGDGPGGARRLVAYVVTRAQASASAAQLKEHLKVGLPEYMVPSAFVFLADLPLSPNGKVDRKALPAPERTSPQGEERYEAPATPAEEALAAIWAELLGVTRISRHENFFELGGDSILSIQVVSRAARAGWKLTPQQLFQYPTLSRLAALAQPAAPEREAAATAPMTGQVRLTPIQRWFFEQEPAEPHHFNQAVLLQLKRPVGPAVIARALTCLVQQHDALRLRFRRVAGGWEQRCEAAVEPVDVPVYPLAVLPAMAEQLQAGLSLTHGPLLRAALFQGESQRLLIAIHHLAVDGVSWRILLEDLQMAIEQLTAGREPVLPPRTTSYQAWAEALAAHEPEGRHYWLAPGRAAAAALPVDHGTGPDTYGSARTVTVTLSPGETRSLLSAVPAAYRTRIDDVLLTALGQTLTAWTRRGAVLVDLEGHGREEIAPGLDLSRTVGWFTSLYPVMLRMPKAGRGPADALLAVKEQLRAVPGKGLGYGVLRYLQGDAALTAMPEAQVCFNYLGQTDQLRSHLLELAPEPAGSTRSPLLARRHLLEVDAMVADEQLTVTWTHSANRHTDQTVASLAHSFTENLRDLIQHCLTPGAGGCTPSDFPLARLTQAELDATLLEAGATPAGVEDLYPLTALQRTMLTRTALADDPGMYMIQLGLELGGAVDTGALEQAWQLVVQRHSILRSSFAFRAASEPVQVVHRQVSVPLARLAVDSVEEMERYLEADRLLGFDLNRAPLLRLALVQTGHGRHCLLLSIHHLLLDGWSNGVLLAEVVAVYAALTRGAALQLPPARPFREYIEWLSRQDQAEGELFWQQALAGVSDLTPLPLAGVAREEVWGPGRVPEVESRLEGSLLEDLQRLARRRQLTMNTLVQGAWAALLSSHARTDEVLFGASTAGRPTDLPGVEAMVGPFTATLPVRVRVALAQPVLALLGQMQQEAAAARSFEHCPPADRPLYESLVAFENYPLSQVPGDLQVLRARHLEQNHYRLTLFAIPEGEGLTLKLVYDRSRYSGETASRLLSQLQRLLAVLPEAPVDWPVREWLAVLEEAGVAAD